MKNTTDTHKNGMILFVMAAGFVLVALAIMFAPQPEVKVTNTGAGSGNTQANTISVSGNSELTVSPDTAELYIRIVTEEPTANRAQEENARLTNTVRDALKSKYNLDDDQIESTSYNLYPQQTYNPDTRKYEENGYRAQHVLKLTTEELADIGDMSDTAVQNGANGIDRISFTLSDKLEKDVRDQALGRAAESARKKAVSLTQSLGVTLGDVSSITESNYNYDSYTYAAPMMEAADMGEGRAFKTDISPQDVTVKASVDVAYEIA